MNNFKNRKILGLSIVPAQKRSACVETRTVQMPNGDLLRARRRISETGEHEWTAEIPLEIAKEIYADD